MPDHTQETRHIGITTPLGEDKFLLRRFKGSEGISRLFRYEVDLFSTEPNIAFDDIVGQSVTIRIDKVGGEKRHINGYVSRFIQGVPAGELFEYKAEIVPFLWLLTRTRDCRIWQEKKVPEIVKELCSEFGFSDIEERLESSSYQPRTYCVQYNETAFDFISRLLEDEGIYYYFTHEDGKHTLILCDSNSRHEESEGYGEIPFRTTDNTAIGQDEDSFHRELITDWQVERNLQPGKYATTDYNFTTPQTSLLATGQITQGHQKADMEVFEYPGEYPDKTMGDRLAAQRMESLAMPHHLIKAVTLARGVTPGITFSLTDYWRDDQNGKYLITGIEVNGGVNDYSDVDRSVSAPYLCTMEVLPFDKQYRPLRRSPKPRIHSLQTAVVVGTQDYEIDTDAHGRVKVQFHWDRKGQKDQNSSCWIRVAQTMAGPQWGGQWIPRMGMEVLVAFVGGDPDQPLVVGAVYNDVNKPPYTLPDNKTQSGMKTRSATQANDKNFNELRFEDKKGYEEVYFHAEKNMTRVVENDDNQNIGFGKQDPGSQTVEIYKDQTVTIGKGSGDGSQTVNIQQDQTVTLEAGNHKTHAKGGNVDIKADGGVITIEAATKIVLKVGGASITIESSKIEINGSGGKVTVDATSVKSDGSGSTCDLEPGSAKLASAQTTVEGSGTATLKGAMAEVNGSGMAKVAGGSIMIG